MKIPECIIFDCDGVLVDSEVISVKLLLSMAAEYGVEMDLREAVELFSGIRLRESINILEKLAHRTFAPDFEQTFRKRTYEIFRHEMKPVKGIEQVLAGLSLPFCVASSGPIEKIRLNLEITGLLPYFEGRIYSGYTINSWKPDPGIFLYAAQEMGFAPAHCAVIEDSKAGVIAAVKGGFQTFGYAKSYNANELANEGATIFFDMAALPALLSVPATGGIPSPAFTSPQ